MTLASAKAYILANTLSCSTASAANWVSIPQATTVSNCTHTTASTAGGAVFVAPAERADPVKALAEVLRSGAALDIPSGWGGDLRLPDGTVVKNQGGDNFLVVDKDARVTYRGNRDRAFNRYVNASDLLEAFIDFLGDLGVPQHRLLDCPIDVLVHWLITEAAALDGEDVPDGVGVRAHPKLAVVRPGRHDVRCRHCRRFIPALNFDEGFLYCSIPHREAFVARKAHDAGRDRTTGNGGG